MLYDSNFPPPIPFLQLFFKSDNLVGKLPCVIISCSDAAQEKELLLEYDRLNDYKNLVYVVIGAWLMHKVKSNDINSEKVGSFLDNLINNIPDFRGLLDLYAMPDMADRSVTAHRNNPLGFNNWDWPHTDSQVWIMPFYQFLMLKKAMQHDVSMTKLQNIRQTEGASHESLKEFLSTIVSAGYSIPPEYQSFTWTLDTQQLQKAKERINELLNFWSSQPKTKSSDE